MSVTGTHNLTVQSCQFDQVRTIGIWSDNAGPGDPVTHHRVLRNTVVKANGDAFSYFGTLQDALVDGADEAGASGAGRGHAPLARVGGATTGAGPTRRVRK